MYTTLIIYTTLIDLPYYGYSLCGTTVWQSLKKLHFTVQIGSTPLYQASFMGNADEVKELLEDGVDINQQNDVSACI